MNTLLVESGWKTYEIVKVWNTVTVKEVKAKKKKIKNEDFNI